MATIAINISKNPRDKFGEEGVQEFVSILNQIKTTQMEEMERLNGRTYEKFQRELTHHRELLSSQIDHIGERLGGEIKQSEERRRGEFDKKLAEQHANLIKWMFIFWSTTIITMVAGYLLK
jgi:hypothetical protein